MNRPSNASTWIKPAAFITAAIAIGVAWSWLAGCTFMLINRTSPNDVAPFTFWSYLWHYHATDSVLKQLALSAIAPTLPALLLVAWLTTQRRSLHGDARFATHAEIRKAGFLNDRGVIIGQHRGECLMSDGPFHVLLAAPTRSGKGVSVAIPNLLNFSDSVVVLDIKQENWDKTAGFRSRHGQQCILFNPAARDYRSHRWNPLAYVSVDEHFRVDDLQKIGSMLWPETQGNEGFWDQLAASLFLGISLFVMDTPELPFTIGECLRQSMKPNLQRRFLKLINDRQEAGQPLPAQCVHALTAFAGRSENTTASILSTYQAKLNIWLNPVVDAATSANDFDIRDLRRQRMSIYIGITPDNLARLSPVINLFFQQVIDLQMRKLPDQDPSLKYQVLLLMDEFTAMGKVSILCESIAYVAGYGIRLLPIIQSTSQLVDRYGQYQARNFIENHAVRVVFAPEDINVAKEISETLGYQTVKSISTSKQRGWTAKRGQHGENESDQRRALMLPQELIELGQDNQIVFSRGTKPILSNKIRYYQDKRFTHRLLPPPPVPTLQLTTSVEIHVDQEPAPDSPQEQTRPITTSDLPALDTLPLARFSCDFSDVEIPTDPVSDADVSALVDIFFNRIEANA